MSSELYQVAQMAIRYAEQVKALGIDIFVNLHPHTNQVSVSIHNQGWETNSSYDESYDYTITSDEYMKGHYMERNSEFLTRIGGVL